MATPRVAAFSGPFSQKLGGWGVRREFSGRGPGLLRSCFGMTASKHRMPLFGGKRTKFLRSTSPSVSIHKLAFTLSHSIQQHEPNQPHSPFSLPGLAPWVQRFHPTGPTLKMKSGVCNGVNHAPGCQSGRTWKCSGKCSRGCSGKSGCSGGVPEGASGIRGAPASVFLLMAHIEHP